MPILEILQHPIVEKKCYERFSFFSNELIFRDGSWNKRVRRAQTTRMWYTSSTYSWKTMASDGNLFVLGFHFVVDELVVTMPCEKLSLRVRGESVYGHVEASLGKVGKKQAREILSRSWIKPLSLGSRATSHTSPKRWPWNWWEPKRKRLRWPSQGRSKIT